MAMRPTGRATPRTIAEVGEFGFLAAILRDIRRAPRTIVGPGQDCAIVRCGNRPYLLTIDALAADTHFRSEWLSPRQIGRKSVLINASDVAAMGGTPRFCLVGLGAPPDYLARDLRALQRGIVEAAGACGAAVVGGNLTRTRQLVVTIALLAEAPRRVVTRRGARPGDHVFVTGTLGDAAQAVRDLSAGRRPLPRALRRLRRPEPRLQAGRVLVDHGIAASMIDVSDGLVQDLGHICEQSRVGAEVLVRRVPRWLGSRASQGEDDRLALSGGEDYELLFTVRPQQVPRLQQLAPRLGCPVTWIGRITPGRSVRLLDDHLHPIRLARGGYDHFRANAPNAPGEDP